MEFKPSFMPFKHDPGTNDCSKPVDFSEALLPVRCKLHVRYPQSESDAVARENFRSRKTVELPNFEH